MTSKQKEYLYGGLLLMFCVVCSVWGIIERNKLRNNHLIGVARIYQYTSGGRGNAGGTWVDYMLSVNGKNYKGSSRFTTGEIHTENLIKFWNKSFPAVYYPPNPSISDLLLLPKDFKKYGYAFPDSLKWILQYENVK